MRTKPKLVLSLAFATEKKKKLKMNEKKDK